MKYKKKVMLQNPRKPLKFGESALYISSLRNQGNLFSPSAYFSLFRVSKYALKMTFYKNTVLANVCNTIFCFH